MRPPGGGLDAAQRPSRRRVELTRVAFAGASVVGVEDDLSEAAVVDPQFHTGDRDLLVLARAVSDLHVDLGIAGDVVLLHEVEELLELDRFGRVFAAHRGDGTRRRMGRAE